MADYTDNKKKEERADSSQKKRNRHAADRAVFTIITVFLILALTVLFFIICNALFFKVKNIVISGNRYYTNEKIILASKIQFNEAVFSLNTSEAQKNILEELGYIKDVKIKVTLPNTIKITIVNDTGIYRFKIGGEYYILSESFKVLCKESDIIKNHAVDDELKEETTVENQQILFKTKTVKKCFVGENIIFSDVDTENIVRMFYDLFKENEIINKVNEINLEEKFNIYLMYDNKYKIKFGNFDDTEIKLKTALAAIEQIDADDYNHKGTIDVTNKKEAIFFSDNYVY